MPYGRGRGWFGGGRGFGRGLGMGWGSGFGRGRGFGPGMGRGIGNPYPFCRFYPWLPRRGMGYGAYYPAAPYATAYDW